MTPGGPVHCENVPETYVTPVDSRRPTGPSPSTDTNCPTAEDTPPLPSTKVTSETMMLSSSTEPQLVQTALPRAWSTSTSVPPHVTHVLELMVRSGGQEVRS